MAWIERVKKYFRKDSNSELAGSQTDASQPFTDGSASEIMDPSRGAESDQSYQDGRVSIPEYAYQHGFRDGTYRLEENHFDDFITNEKLVRRARYEKKVVEKKLAELEAQLSHGELAAVELFDQKAELEARAASIQHELDKLEKDQAREKEEVAEKKGWIQNLEISYGWLAAGLMFAAAVAMILADFALSKSVIKDGLGMSGHEANLFTYGLTAMPFIVKLAYDRIFEKRYRQGKLIAATHWVLVITALLAILSLTIMGLVRNKAISPTEENQPDNSGGLVSQDILQDPEVLLLFGITGFLLGLIGGILFSVTIPVLENLVKKNYWRLLVEEGKSKVKKLGKQILRVRQKLEGAKGEVEKVQNRLQKLPESGNLREKIEAFVAKDLDLFAEILAHQTEANKDWYAQGKARGEKYELEDDLTISNVKSTDEGQAPESGGRQSPFNSNPFPSQASGKSSDYLHEQLREEIRKQVRAIKN